MLMRKRTTPDKDFFAVPPSTKPLIHAGKIPIRHEGGVHTIESLLTLKKLLAEVRLKKQKPILRFIVDKECTAWFAHESSPGINTPKHFQMTGDDLSTAHCLTAGNIKFTNTSCTKLKSINNKSGDFQPPFDSLRIFIAILLINEALLPFTLPRTLVVKKMDDNRRTLKKYKWSVVLLREWVKTFHTDTALIQNIQNQLIEPKTVSYPAIDTTATAGA